MQRMTKRVGLKVEFEKGVCLPDVKRRLAAYEDTGLLPEEIPRQAPVQDLFTYLLPEEIYVPCQVPLPYMTAYILRSYYGKKPLIRSGKITQVCSDDSGKLRVTVEKYGSGLLGEKVFLTQAEAEIALEKRKETAEKPSDGG